MMSIWQAAPISNGFAHSCQLASRAATLHRRSGGSAARERQCNRLGAAQPIWGPTLRVGAKTLATTFAILSCSDCSQLGVANKVARILKTSRTVANKRVTRVRKKFRDALAIANESRESRACREPLGECRQRVAKCMKKSRDFLK